VRQHFIYVAGLGDNYDGVRQLMLRTWAWRPGVTTEIVSMHWLSGESYERKVRRVVEAVKNAPKDAEVVLVGESAGGAISLLACAQTKVRCVTVCGKNQRARTIGQDYSSKNVALKPAVTAVDRLHANADLPVERIRNLYSRLDYTVHVDDSKIPGCENIVFSVPSHLVSIAWINLFHFHSIR